MAYVAVIVVLTAIYRSSTKSLLGFGLADRTIGVGGTAVSTFATLASESQVFFAITLAATYGTDAAVASSVGACAGVLILTLIAPAIRRAASRSTFLSISDSFADRWGGWLGRFAKWTVTLFLFWIIVLQLKLNGRVLSGLLGWNEPIATAATVVLVTTYLTVGGYQLVVKTDYFQSAFLAVVFVLPFYVPQYEGALDGLVPSANWRNLMLGLMSMTMVVVRPEVWQRLYASSSSRSAVLGLGLSGILYTVFSFSIIYFAGAIHAAAPSLTADEAFRIGYQRVLPPSVAALFPVMLIAAMLSSLDSAVFLLSSTAARALPERRLSFAGRTRVAIALSLVAAAVISLTPFEPLSIAFALNGLIMILSVPMVVSATANVRRLEVTLALALGAAVYVAQLLAGRLRETPQESIVGAFGGALVLAIFTFARWIRGRHQAPPGESPPSPPMTGGEAPAAIPGDGRAAGRTEAQALRVEAAR